jgi:hypothetical protein
MTENSLILAETAQFEDTAISSELHSRGRSL